MAQRKPAIELHDLLPPVQVAKAVKAYYSKAKPVASAYNRRRKANSISWETKSLAGRSERDRKKYGTQAPRKTRSRSR